jgi:hypothetical protein
MGDSFTGLDNQLTVTFITAAALNGNSKEAETPGYAYDVRVSVALQETVVNWPGRVLERVLETILTRRLLPVRC